DDSGGALFASLAEMNAHFVVEVRDPSAAHDEPPLKTITDDTSTGQIEVPDSGTPYALDSLDAVFTVTLTDPGPSPRSATRKQKLSKGAAAYVDGDFDVAYVADNDTQARRDGTR